MTREEIAKRKFEEDNNVVVHGDWSQIIDRVDELVGSNSGYEGNPKNSPTPKQLNIIEYIQTSCNNEYIFNGSSTRDAWNFIEAHFDEARSRDPQISFIGN